MLEVKVEVDLESLSPLGEQPVVHKLCRIDENGVFVPLTDEEMLEVQSLVQAESSEEENVDQDEAYFTEDIKPTLLRRLEAMNKLLTRVKLEGEERGLESSGNGYTGYNGAKSTYKRRRRPNPKYYGAEGNTEQQPGELQTPQLMLEPVKVEEEPICSSSKVVTPVAPPDATYGSPMNFLDNLSIRALQDTYKDTFGKETSAKDKHWLKRKIAKGLSAMHENVLLGAQPAQENLLRERLDIQPVAEQPFVYATEDMKPKASAATISPTASLDASTTTVASRPSDGQSHLNEVQSLEGKRQRKPNRRYVEEEADDMASSMGRMIPAANSPDHQPLDSEYVFDEEEEEDDDEEENMDLVGDPLDSLSLEGDDGSFDFRKRNRGVDRRAAQLVKNAREIRKIKFKLPSAQGHDNDENYEPNDDSVSCMLPSVSDELQPSDTEEQDTDRKTGSRRKHHRPWTLREVLALVDGVSRCGTGKWADIKRLSFSAITYRTPVDLKDKWRNLLRASRVHSHSSRQPQGGEKRRKHFSVSIPASILQRVRELAAQPGQTMKVPVIRSTRSRRMMQQRKM